MRAGFWPWCFLLLRAPSAMAGDRTATLKWDVPPGCLAPDGLRRDVERRLGRTVFVAPAESDVTLAVREEGNGAVSTVLEVLSGTQSLGIRVVEPMADCETRRRTVTLVAAMLLDAPEQEEKAATESTRAEPPPKPAEPPPPKSAESPPPKSAESPRDGTPGLTKSGERSRGRSTFHGQLTALGSVEVGLLPRFGEGGFVELLAGVGRWPELRVTLGAMFGATVATRKGESEFRSIGTSVAVAPLLVGSFDTVHATGWIGVSADAIVATPSGFDVNHTSTTWLLAAAAGFGAALPLWQSGIFASAEVEAGVPFSRPSFSFEQDGRFVQLHRVSSFGGGASIGLGWRIH